MADDIIGMMDKQWDLTEDKLKKMVAVLEGEILPTPYINECIECKITSAPVLSKKQKESGQIKGIPFTVLPIIPDGQIERYKEQYNIVPEKEYTFFINKASYYQLRPWLMKLKITDTSLQSLRGMYIKVCGQHWADAKPDSLVARMPDGRAISARINALRFAIGQELTVGGDAAKLMEVGGAESQETVDHKAIAEELYGKIGNVEDKVS